MIALLSLFALGLIGLIFTKPQKIEPDMTFLEDQSGKTLYHFDHFPI